MTSLSSQSTNEPWPLVHHLSLPYLLNHVLKRTAGTAPLRHAGNATGSQLPNARDGEGDCEDRAKGRPAASVVCR